MCVNVHQPLRFSGFKPFLLPSITNILCDLSLVVALTHDFVIATQGSVSSKHTLHPHCLCAFPVCPVPASCALKLWRPPLGTWCTEQLSTPQTLHSLQSGDSTTAFLRVHTLVQTHTTHARADSHNTRVQTIGFLHRGAHSTSVHHTVSLFLCSPLSLLISFFYLLTGKAALSIYRKINVWVEARGKQL